MKKNFKKALITIILSGIVLDQLSKMLMEKFLLVNGDVVIIKNFFSFSLIYNKGAAWGIFADQRWLLLVLPAIVIVFAVYYLFKLKKPHLQVAIAVLISGALGNLIDRVFRKEVVDFLDFYIFGYDFPAFNIADTFITLSCIFLFIFLIFEKEESV